MRKRCGLCACMRRMRALTALHTLRALHAGLTAMKITLIMPNGRLGRYLQWSFLRNRAQGLIREARGRQVNVKARTALLSALVSLVLTILKFGLFFLSGSLAVLSEAWHSYTDVVTSLIVFFAVLRLGKKPAAAPAEPEGATAAGEPRGLTKGARKALRVHPELVVAFIIAAFLFVLSISIMQKVFRAPPATISQPLLTGVCFILFSFGSYFLYRFKTIVGNRERSAALVADGLHSKSDMLITLVTGISLLLYHFDVNIDKALSFVIALFILSFAVETIVNVILAHVRGKEEYAVVHKSYEIIWLIWSKMIPRLGRWVPRLAAVPLFLLVISLSTYTVQIDEEAIVERFGKTMHEGKAVGPGLHWKMPWPVDQVFKFKTKRIRTMNIGNIAGSEKALLWAREHGEEIHFLAGDNNFFNPYVVIHYRIKNPHDYLYQQVQPEELLKQVTYRVLTHAYTMESFYTLAIYSRGPWMDEVKKRIQANIDGLRSGLEVTDLFLKDFHPPLRIAGSFEAVIAARQVKQERINRAMGYSGTALPAAQAKAYGQLAEANTFVTEKTKRAEGESQNFILRTGQYNKSPRILGRILYLDCMVKALENNDKILLSPRAGVSDLWLTGELVRESGGFYGE